MGHISLQLKGPCEGNGNNFAELDPPTRSIPLSSETQPLPSVAHACTRSGHSIGKLEIWCIWLVNEKLAAFTNNLCSNLGLRICDDGASIKFFLPAPSHVPIFSVPRHRTDPRLFNLAGVSYSSTPVSKPHTLKAPKPLPQP